MNNNSLPNIPWQERPSGGSEVVWRYDANPIIPRNLIPSSNSIFNSAVVPFNGKFAGVFRCDNKKRDMNVHRGFSSDGITWNLDNDPIEWEYNDPELVIFNIATTRGAVARRPLLCHVVQRLSRSDDWDWVYF